MLFSVSTSGMDRKKLIGLMKLNGLEAIYDHPNYVIFHSLASWDTIQGMLKDFIVSILNPECDLGKDATKQLEKKHVN